MIMTTPSNFIQHNWIFQRIEDTPLGAGSAARCEGMLLSPGKSEARCPTASER